MTARLLKSYGLVIVVALAAAVLWFFRPGGVEGPRPEPVPPEGKGFDHGAFTAVLQRFVGPDGKIDYAGLRAHPEALDRYLGQLRATSPASAPHRFKTGDDRLAYYLNAYNAFVLAGVRDHCPLASVHDAYFGSGFFWRVAYLMGGQEVTLSDLETQHVAEVSRGHPGVHFVMVKGAAGFPPLERRAFSGEDVRERLEAAARRVAHDERFVRREGDKLLLSELFRWYVGDFDGDAVAWLRRYNPAAVEGKPRVEYLPFDWSLNGSCE